MHLRECRRFCWPLILLVLAGCGGGGDSATTTTTTTTPAPAQPAAVIAAIGESDTRVGWTAQDGSLNYFRSSQPDCNIAVPGGCDFTQTVASVAQLPVVDSGVTLGSPGFVQLASDAHKVQFYVSTQRFPARRAFDGVVFDGKRYVIGGRTGGLSAVTEFGDVWSSVDGVNWRQEATAAIPARTGHRVAVHNGKIFVVGGQSGNTLRNDVWTSADGSDWHQLWRLSRLNWVAK